MQQFRLHKLLSVLKSNAYFKSNALMFIEFARSIVSEISTWIQNYIVRFSLLEIKLNLTNIISKINFYKHYRLKTHYLLVLLEPAHYAEQALV